MLLNWTTEIVRVYMVVSKSIHWLKRVIPRYDRSRHTTERNNGASEKLYGPEVN